MHINRRQFNVAATASLWGAGLSAQTSLPKSISLVVPNAAGGSNDVMARAVAMRLPQVLGSAVVAGYALAQGVQASPVGDGLMLVAILTCGLGYAEGARLTPHLGGWQVISWSLVLALPVMLPVAAWAAPSTLQDIALPAWLGLTYVSVFSMLVGFVFWYKGLAEGGVAAVSQLQLLQPFFGMLLASALLHEPVTWPMLATALGVIACVAGARRFAR